MEMAVGDSQTMVVEFPVDVGKGVRTLGEVRGSGSERRRRRRRAIVLLLSINHHHHHHHHHHYHYEK